jgi:hypothetical protein
VVESATWILRIGVQELGTLTWAGTDQPFHEYRFEPKPPYDSVRPLFEEELRLLNAERMNEWDAAYQRVLDSGLSVESPDGSQRLLAFILHIDGRSAWMTHLEPGETF